ncbi:Hypothetical_protein [Hexamita inflata]|uniref:Hypothetical_protein n=1 Tax=Hexamita inflata TaxID=28002 RepID=A0AA86TVC3_9EUKA|nr:Hypothetical protein HINF_LOCUS17641 [Hexamita inflata]
MPSYCHLSYKKQNRSHLSYLLSRNENNQLYIQTFSCYQKDLQNKLRTRKSQWRVCEKVTCDNAVRDSWLEECCWFLIDHWLRKEKKCDYQRKRVTSLDVICGVMFSVFKHQDFQTFIKVRYLSNTRLSVNYIIELLMMLYTFIIYI